MAVGNWTVFNLALPKLSGTIILPSDGFKLALTTSTQAITHAFTGSSANAQYSDLTNEVANGNGYSTGGVALGSVIWLQSAGVATFTSATANWTLTGGGITFKYGIIYDTTATNKDMLCFFDVNPGGGSQSPGAGGFSIQMNASGIFTLTQTNPQD